MTDPTPIVPPSTSSEVVPPPPPATSSEVMTGPPPAATPTPLAPVVAAGWYDDGTGRQRWYDGNQWTEVYAPVQHGAAPPVHTTGPATAASLNVNRQVIYNREQKGHSIVLHLLFGWIVLYIPTIYFAVSPNHYFHA